MQIAFKLASNDTLGKLSEFSKALYGKVSLDPYEFTQYVHISLHYLSHVHLDISLQERRFDLRQERRYIIVNKTEVIT